MLWIATVAAITANSSAAEISPRAQPQRQARAVVRIVRAATIDFADDCSTASEDRLMTQASIREEDGVVRPLLLVEFR